MKTESSTITLFEEEVRSAASGRNSFLIDLAQQAINGKQLKKQSLYLNEEDDEDIEIIGGFVLLRQSGGRAVFSALSTNSTSSGYIFRFHAGDREISDIISTAKATKILEKAGVNVLGCEGISAATLGTNGSSQMVTCTVWKRHKVLSHVGGSEEESIGILGETAASLHEADRMTLSSIGGLLSDSASQRVGDLERYYSIINPQVPEFIKNELRHLINDASESLMKISTAENPVLNHLDLVPTNAVVDNKNNVLLIDPDTLSLGNKELIFVKPEIRSRFFHRDQDKKSFYSGYENFSGVPVHFSSSVKEREKFGYLNKDVLDAGIIANIAHRAVWLVSNAHLSEKYLEEAKLILSTYVDTGTEKSSVSWNPL